MTINDCVKDLQCKFEMVRDIPHISMLINSKQVAVATLSVRNGSILQLGRQSKHPSKMNSFY